LHGDKDKESHKSKLSVAISLMPKKEKIKTSILYLKFVLNIKKKVVTLRTEN